MTYQERIIRVFRHAPRNFILPGQLVTLSNGFSDFSGPGVHIDGEAHIDPKGRETAVQVGLNCYIPEDWKPDNIVYVCGSPLVRAEETDLAIAEGMMIKHYEKIGIPEKNRLRNVHTLSPELKQRIIQDGLKIAWSPDSALTEARYFGKDGDDLITDEGNQLYVESQLPENKQRFPLGNFRYQATRAMDKQDQRVRDPKNIALGYHPKEAGNRALTHLVKMVRQFRIVQGTTHTWNIEAIMVTLNGNGVGKDGNELYDNAGGGFDQCGYLEARIEFDPETKKLAPTMQVFRTMPLELSRTESYNGTRLQQPVELSTKVLSLESLYYDLRK